MSLSQWNQNVSASMTAVIGTPAISGAASLILTSTAFGQVAYLTPTGASGFMKGIEQGRLRTLVQPRSSSGNGYGFGLVCMGSADTLGTVNGAFYRFEFFITGSYSLVRGTAHVLSAGTPGTIVASGSTTTTQNVTYGMQIEWIADSVNLGGVYLALKKGTATDFSDLTFLTQIHDVSTAALVTSVSEGVYMRGYTSVTGAIVAFDQTELFLL